MALADEAIKLGGKPGSICGVHLLYDALTPSQRKDARDAINNPDVPATGIVRAMKKRGWNAPAAQTITRHRRGDCSCESR